MAIAPRREKTADVAPVWGSSDGVGLDVGAGFGVGVGVGVGAGVGDTASATVIFFSYLAIACVLPIEALIL
jgi:hypothetical protein